MQAGQLGDSGAEEVWAEHLRHVIHNFCMPWLSKRQFDEALCARVKDLRKTRGWTQEDMAAALDVSKSAYEKYEIRTPLPSFLVPRFAQLIGCSISYLMTGKQDRSPPRPQGGGRSRRDKLTNVDESSTRRLTR